MLISSSCERWAALVTVEPWLPDICHYKNSLHGLTPHMTMDPHLSTDLHYVCRVRTRLWHLLLWQGKFQQLIWKEMSIHYAAAPFIKLMTFQSAHFLQFQYFAIWAQVSNYARATSFTSILQFLHSPYTIAPPVSCKKRNRWFLNNQIVKMVRMSKKLKTSSSTAPWCWNWYSSFSNMNLCCLSILRSSWDSLGKNLDKDSFIKICLRQSGCLKISE